MHEQLTTPNEFHDEEDLKVGLEHVFHANKERMVSFLQDLLFKHGALNLIVIQNDILSE